MDSIKKRVVEYYENNGYTVHTAKTARWQEIKFDGKADPYVTYYGKKCPLDMFMWDSKREHLFYCESAFSALELVLDDSCSNAMVIWSRV